MMKLVRGAIATAMTIGMLGISLTVGVAAAHADGNTIFVDPGTTVVPGEEITLYGLYCDPNGGYVDLTVNGISLPPAYSDPDPDNNGAWSTTYTIPMDTPPGPLTVSGVCVVENPEYNLTYDDTTLTIDRVGTVSITPGTAAPGQVVTFSGDACSGEGFYVIVFVNGVQMPNAPADNSGNWTTTYTIPLETPDGSLPLSFECRDYDDLHYSSYPAASVVVQTPSSPPPAVNLGLTLDIAQGDPVTGAPSTATASGLQEGADYTITVRSTPIVVGSGTVPTGGLVSRIVNIPAGLEPGWHTITFTSTFYTGAPASKTLWFEVGAGGVLLQTSTTEPTLASTGATSNGALFVALLALNVGLGLLMIRARRESARPV